MIISSCPLRISLVGGSTDHPEFLNKYKKGAVISFASNLKTYSIIHKDVIGYNSVYHKYILNYSERECVDHVSEIKNELIRGCFENMNVKEINCYLTSDIFSSGSGLASSSSYLISLIKSVMSLNNQKADVIEICKTAMEIEKKFNPLVGQQDFYGGSIGGLKKITFFEDKDPRIDLLDDSIFKKFDMYIFYTNTNRSSTDILKTINVDKSFLLLNEVQEMEIAILNQDVERFMNIIKKSWDLKKKTSVSICDGEIGEIDKKLSENKNVLAHKLCGAGGGGYFLIFVKKNATGLLDDFKNMKKIKISKKGLQCKNI